MRGKAAVGQEGQRETDGRKMAIRESLLGENHARDKFQIQSPD
jgi:hypothetical protein